MGKIANAKRIVNQIAESTGLKLTPLQKFGVLLDYMSEIYIHGVRPVEYIQFDFYWKSKRDRRRYACLRQLNEIVAVANKKEDFKYFDDKILFAKTFSKYIGRDWLDVNECSLEDFEEMLRKHDKLFVKPKEGLMGEGVYVQDTKNDDPKKLFEDLKAKQVIVEEVFEQYEEMAEFNPSSVNTLRVVTMLCPDQSVRIMATILRMGRKGSVVDNFHFFSVAAGVDVETGYVVTTGVDKTYARYVKHPDSQKVIIGFKIPNWDKVVETVTEAARVVPTVRYIGWDIAIGKNGQVVIIEGNKWAEPDAEQVTERTGHWPMYKEMLDLYRGKD